MSALDELRRLRGEQPGRTDAWAAYNRAINLIENQDDPFNTAARDQRGIARVGLARVLEYAANEWGALGVALAAAERTDRDVLISELTTPRGASDDEPSNPDGRTGSALEYLRACHTATVEYADSAVTRGDPIAFTAACTRRDTLAEAIRAIERDDLGVDMLMTSEEHEFVGMLGQCADRFAKIIGDGPSRDGDIGEVVAEIHHLQTRVLAQAAGRAFPDRYRTLGGTVQR